MNGIDEFEENEQDNHEDNVVQRIRDDRSEKYRESTNMENS